MSYHLNLQQIVQNFLQDLYKAPHSSLAKSGATVTTYRHQTSRGRKIHQILEFCINLEVPRNLVCLEILEAWKSCVTWILRVSSHVSPSSLLCMSPCCLVRSEAPLHFSDLSSVTKRHFRSLQCSGASQGFMSNDCKLSSTICKDILDSRVWFLRGVCARHDQDYLLHLYYLKPSLAPQLRLKYYRYFSHNRLFTISKSNSNIGHFIRSSPL